VSVKRARDLSFYNEVFASNKTVENNFYSCLTSTATDTCVAVQSSVRTGL